MSDDLLQLFFAAALILFALLGSRKKKPTQQPPRRRPAQPPHPRPATSQGRAPAPRPPAPRPAPRRPAPAQPRDALLQELERLLGRPVEAESLEEFPEAVSLEATDVEEKRVRPEGPGARWTEGLDRGAESLETLEEAGEAGHARFHARLQATADVAPAAAREVDPAIVRLRHAIIWSEILGPPVSLR